MGNKFFKIAELLLLVLVFSCLTVLIFIAYKVIVDDKECVLDPVAYYYKSQNETCIGEGLCYSSLLINDDPIQDWPPVVRHPNLTLNLTKK